MRNAKNSQKRIRKGIALRSCVSVVVNLGTWLVLVARANTGEPRMRKTNSPDALVKNEGNEPGGDRCADLTGGS
jgi:hypothetical protein